MQTAIGEQRTVPSRDIERGFHDEGNQIAFVILCYIVIACNVGFKGVVTRFQSDADNPVD